ncbi:MAG TPA: archaeosortase/exosortase family protein [archaeon]|nr:archaeosortase/exosortase family protein [archaeon]
MMRKRKSRLRPAGLRLTGEQQKLWGTLVFLAKILVLSLPLYFIILFSISLSPLQQLDAAVSAGILRSMGYDVEREGAYLTVGTEKAFSFYLTEDCTAWKSFLLLFALVFAMPAIALRSRIKGLAFGLPILWLGNQARIVGVVLTERATSVQFAMLTHDYAWRVFLVAFVLGVWFLWLKNPGLEFRIRWLEGVKRRLLTQKPGIRRVTRARRSPRLLTRKAKR